MSLRFRKLLAKDDKYELDKFKYHLLFSEYSHSHYLRYSYVWAFCLRRILNAAILLLLQTSPLWQLNLLMLVNLLALAFSCVSRPYNDTLLNAHTIINDVAVLVVIGEFYMMWDPYVSDRLYYQQGQIIIATIATVIFLNFLLFLLSFVLGVIAFLKRCPMCSCCTKKRIRDKEDLIREKEFDIDMHKEEIYHTPTPEPEPTPPPTPPPPKTPTPPPEPVEEVKEPTPESSESEPEIVIGAAAVLVKEDKFDEGEGGDKTFGETMAVT